MKHRCVKDNKFMHAETKMNENDMGPLGINLHNN